MSWQPKPVKPATKDKDSQAEDICLPSPPSDGVTSLSVNANTSMLIAGSWDCSVR